MAIPALNSTRSFSAPPPPPAANGRSSGPVAVAAPPSRNSVDQVNLSSSGLALQQADVAQEAGLLGKLTRASLANVIPNADNAQISFDQLTYSDQRSVSFAQSGNARLFQSEQQTSLSGSGRITTADGQVFEFSAELEVSIQTEIAEVGNFGGSAGIGLANQPRQVGPGRNAPIIPPNLVNDSLALQLPGIEELEEASDRLLDLLQQLGPQSVASNDTRPLAA
jgi:hypothetical protein